MRLRYPVRQTVVALGDLNPRAVHRSSAEHKDGELSHSGGDQAARQQSQQGACVLPTRFLQPAVNCSRHASRHAQILRTALPVSGRLLSATAAAGTSRALASRLPRGVRRAWISKVNMCDLAGGLLIMTYIISKTHDWPCALREEADITVGLEDSIR